MLSGVFPRSRHERFDLVRFLDDILRQHLAPVLGDQEIILNEGDSIYFNPTYKHGQRCYGDTKARFLTMIAE